MTSKIRKYNAKIRKLIRSDTIAFLRSQTSWNWGLTVEPGPWKGRRWQSLGVWNPGPNGCEKRFIHLTTLRVVKNMAILENSSFIFSFLCISFLFLSLSLFICFFLSLSLSLAPLFASFLFPCPKSFLSTSGFILYIPRCYLSIELNKPRDRKTNIAPVRIARGSLYVWQPIMTRLQSFVK